MGTLKFSSKAILDCAWSPHSSTVMASVSDGGLSIWDLSVQELDPIVVLGTTASGTKLTSVTFSSKTNAVLYGDSDGKITVAMLKKFLADLATLQPKRQSCSALSPRTRRRGLG